MKSHRPRLLISCEHGGHQVPLEYRRLFHGRARLLRSHRGYDKGALPAAKLLARFLGAGLEASTITRLLIDPNRSIENPAVFSEWSSSLLPREKERAIGLYHRTYSARVERNLRAQLEATSRANHFSIHSFTPVLRGIRRDCGVGILFDPSSLRERVIARALAKRLIDSRPRLRVRFNYPYKGTTDGLTTALRKKMGAPYSGIEIELNQRFIGRLSREKLKSFCFDLAQAIDHALLLEARKRNGKP